MSIFINLVLTRLSTGSNRLISLPENIKPALTQIIRNGNEIGPRDDSDFENKLQSENSAYQIARTLPRAIIKKVLKN
jgi:hypothetical protein